MNEYNGFDSREEYLRHTKKSLYKNGLKCMVLCVAILVLMMFLGLDEMEAVSVAIGFPKEIVMFIPKFITVSFGIGSVAYLVSLSIKDTDDK